MANISIKLNLRQLKSEILKREGKDDCIIIPVNQNNLFVGEKGIYLDVNALELKNPIEGSKKTHLLKQNLGKEVYGKMSKEEKEAMPILGDAIYWGKREAAPQNVETNVSAEDTDDLG